MSDGTKIQWTDATWNPIRARRRDGQPNRAGGGWACQRVSPGCVHCYAAGINKRLGTGLDYDARGIADSDIYLDERILAAPLRWKSPRRVFVCSMTDLFGEWVPDEVIDRVFAVMALSPQHTYQLLTKRPERMREYVQRHSAYPLAGTLNDLFSFGHILGLDGVPRNAVDAWTGWPLPNVWLGVSAEDQERADQRIPELLATPAAVRFVSYEPALELVDFSPWLMRVATSGYGWRMSGGTALAIADVVLDWVIVGGESGPGARAFDLGWARSVVRQCQAAGVAVFCKQLGARPYSVDEDPKAWPNKLGWDVDFHATRMAKRPVWNVYLRDRKGGDMSEWPEDLKVRDFPNV